MFFTRTAVLLAILPFSIAATCTSSNALLYTSTPNNGGKDQAAVDAAFVTCTSGCGSSVSCLTGCLDDACTSHCGSATSSCHLSCLNDPCSAFYGSGSNSPDQDQLKACYKARNNSTRRRSLVLEGRDTLTCSSSETCYKETNGNLFCLQASTGDYHDIEGGNGNVNTGEYTSAGSSTPTSTRGSSSSTATRGSSSTATATATTSSSGTTSTTSATLGAAASPSPSRAGVERLRANAAIAALGLVLGFVAL